MDMEIVRQNCLNICNDIPCKKLPAAGLTTLQDLIRELHSAFESDIVNVEYVQHLMCNYKSNPVDWKKYSKFDRYRYTRNLVDEGNGKFNLMILCWGEGHGSAIHDHADAHCFMKVMQGSLAEVRFEFPKDGQPDVTKNEDENEEDPVLKEISRTRLNLNEVCYINDSLGLHRIENPSNIDPAVSLHLYCPPFDTCNVFNQRTGQRTSCKVTFWSKFGEKRNRLAICCNYCNLIPAFDWCKMDRASELHPSCINCMKFKLRLLQKIINEWLLFSHQNHLLQVA